MAEELDVSLDQIKTVITTLKSRNSALADENNALKLEIESMKTEIGGKLFRDRSTFGELINVVESLKETIARKVSSKEGNGNRPIKVVMAEVSATPSPSMRLARQLLEGDDDLSLEQRKHLPAQIEEL